MAVGSATITLTTIQTPYIDDHGVVKAVISFIGSSTDGSVPDTAFSATDIADIIGRKCELAVTIPGSSVAPTALYDITVEDEYDCDIFAAELNDLSATLVEQTTPLIGSLYGGRLVTGDLTFKLANNSVNSATGTCVLYFRL